MLSLRLLWTLLSRSTGERDGSYVGAWMVIGGMEVEETTKRESTKG